MKERTWNEEKEDPGVKANLGTYLAEPRRKKKASKDDL